jgi:hypothetical protein
MKFWPLAEETVGLTPPVALSQDWNFFVRVAFLKTDPALESVQHRRANPRGSANRPESTGSRTRRNERNQTASFRV